jgi:hypothetical protein
MKKDTIAWECIHCGKRWLWTWDKYDAEDGDSIGMMCEYGCGNETIGTLRLIGRRGFELTFALTEREPYDPI